MKTFKPYILSVLTLICMAPLNAMQAPASKQVQSAKTMNTNLVVKRIETEVNAIATEMVNSIKNVRSGQPKEVNSLNANKRLDELITQLPDSMRELRQLLVKFLGRVNAFDRASANDGIIDLAKRVNEVCKEIKLHIQKAEYIDELKTLTNSKVQTITEADARLLKDLAQALHADVEKMVNFDVRSQKVPGAFKLATNLEPFVNRLTGSLAELQSPLNIYISAAQAFDAAADTELMNHVSNAVEYLSERIAHFRNLEIKSAINEIKSGPKVRFNDKPEIKTFKVKKQEPKEAPQQVPAEQAVVSIPKKQKVRQPILTPEEMKNGLIISSCLAAPAVGAGLVAAYNSGYLTPNIDTAPIANISNAVVNTTTAIGGQLVATGRAIGNSIGRNLGKLGTSASRLTPQQSAILFASAVGGVGAGAYGIRRFFNNKPQPSSVVIEELDQNNNVIASSNAVRMPKDKKEKRKFITKNRAFATGLAGLAAYGLYNYFQPAVLETVAAIANPAEMNAVPVIQPNLLPQVAPSFTPAIHYAAPVVSASAPSIMGQNVYQWLAGNATNSFQ